MLLDLRLLRWISTPLLLATFGQHWSCCVIVPAAPRRQQDQKSDADGHQELQATKPACATDMVRHSQASLVNSQEATDFINASVLCT